MPPPLSFISRQAHASLRRSIFCSIHCLRPLDASTTKVPNSSCTYCTTKSRPAIFPNSPRFQTAAAPRLAGPRRARGGTGRWQHVNRRERLGFPQRVTGPHLTCAAEPRPGTSSSSSSSLRRLVLPCAEDSDTSPTNSRPFLLLSAQ